MIKIIIETDGKDVFDSFKHKDITLLENSLVIRRLEEIKLKLLTEFEFESKFETEEIEE